MVKHDGAGVRGGSERRSDFDEPGRSVGDDGGLIGDDKLRSVGDDKPESVGGYDEDGIAVDKVDDLGGCKASDKVNSSGGGDMGLMHKLFEGGMP